MTLTAMGSPKRRRDSGTPPPPGEDETPPVRVSRKNRSRSRERRPRRSSRDRSPASNKRGSMDDWDKSTQQFLSKIGAPASSDRGKGPSSNYSSYGSGSSNYGRQGYGPPPVHSIPMVSLHLHHPIFALTMAFKILCVCVDCGLMLNQWFFFAKIGFANLPVS